MAAQKTYSNIDYIKELFFELEKTNGHVVSEDEKKETIRLIKAYFLEVEPEQVADFI